MKIIPGVGTDTISFGMASDDVDALLGTPETITPYEDLPGYPSGRKNRTYGHLDILTTRTHGVIAITVDCAMAELTLWGHPLAGCDTDAITQMLQQAEGHIEVSDRDQWGDFDIYLAGTGLSFAMSDAGLVAVEVRQPDWRDLA